MRQVVSVDYVIEFLNSALKDDKEAIHNLIEQRVICNEKLADHPTIQVSCKNKEQFEVGLLGILNGLFGTTEEGLGLISAVYEDDRLVGFKKTNLNGA